MRTPRSGTSTAQFCRRTERRRPSVSRPRAVGSSSSGSMPRRSSNASEAASAVFIRGLPYRSTPSGRVAVCLRAWWRPAAAPAATAPNTVPTTDSDQHAPGRRSRTPPQARRAIASALALHASVVIAPDQPVDAEVPRQPPQAGYERDADEGETEQAHQGEDQRVRVDRGIEGRDLVPEGVEPEPHLAGIAARLVHHSPLRTEQVLGGGAVLEVAAAR